jgi:hypothetical protein
VDESSSAHVNGETIHAFFRLCEEANAYHYCRGRSDRLFVIISVDEALQKVLRSVLKGWVYSPIMCFFAAYTLSMILLHG